MTPTQPVPSPSGVQGDRLPKLTKPQMARLVEIGTYPNTGRTDVRSRTTAALIELGCADLGRKIKGDLYAVELDALGIRILAGLPGDEFDRFRAALATEERARLGDGTEGT